jgi:hypothetical protein
MASSGIDVPYRTLVIKADPDFERDARNVTEYEFTRRRFTANPAERGAFNVVSNGVFEPNSWPSAVYVGAIGSGPPGTVDPTPVGDLPTLPPGYQFVTYLGAYVTVAGNFLIYPIP